MRTRTTALTGAVIATVVTLACPASMARAVAPELPTPGDMTVTRVLASPNDFTVAWTGEVGPSDRFQVTVTADGDRSVYTTKAHSLTVRGNTLLTVYRVDVASLHEGDVSDPATVVLPPALPSAPTGLVSEPDGGTGIALSWHAPARPGRTPITRYRVTLVDADDGTVTRQEVTEAATTATVDPTRSYRVTITAVGADGPGLALTDQVGGNLPQAPNGFTAYRDPDQRQTVHLAWSTPSWAGVSPISGYEIGVESGGVVVWTGVGQVNSTAVSLSVNRSEVYYVRAVSAAGASAPDSTDVTAAVRTLLPSSAAPVVVSSDGHEVDVAIYQWLGEERLNRLRVRLTSRSGHHVQEKVLSNGSDGVTFDGVPFGRYDVVILGEAQSEDDDEDGPSSDRFLFTGSVTVDNGHGSNNSLDMTFESGIGFWRAVYPARRLPRLVSTTKAAYNGDNSLAITAMAPSERDNLAASTTAAGGVPVLPGQFATIVAQGRAEMPSWWNVGIEWLDKDGRRIAVVRSKVTRTSQTAWQPAKATAKAPARAVTAVAFVEVGGLSKGKSFYLDATQLTGT